MPKKTQPTRAQNQEKKKLLEQGMARCFICNKIKETKDFIKHGKCLGGIKNNCIPCYRKMNYDYIHADIEKYCNNVRFKTVKFTYGLSKSDYLGLILSHNNMCAICGITPEEQTEKIRKDSRLKKKKNLCIDHDHKTNKVRGLLCASCNLGLGYLEDDINLLKKAIQYLEKYK